MCYRIKFSNVDFMRFFDPGCGSWVTRLFLQFLYKKGYIYQNLAKNLFFAKRIKGVPNYLTKEEMKKLLQVSQDNFFHHVIIHTFYELGLRLSELINLKIEDIDSSSMRIRALGKGQKVRYIPFSQQLLEKFRKLVKTQNGYRKQGYLFVLPDGSPLGPSYLQQMIRNYAQKAGIGKKISPKILRHTHATHSLEAGIDVFTLQKNLGHQDLSSTLIYTHIADSSFSQSHQKLLVYIRS